jgi:CDP-glucose 4,6-dehydratase
MISSYKKYSGQKVFITGHTGFKGSWLTFVMKELGAEVCGYSLKSDDAQSHFNQLGLKSEIHNIAADIRDKERLISEMKSFRPDYVFHLAAQAIVRKSYADPSLTFETNVIGSLNLLEAVRATPQVKSLIYVTSDKCYENTEWVYGYRETDQLGGIDPYSASKSSAEILFSSYTRSYFSSRDDLGFASVRAGNVIGGGDWSEDRIIPDCIRAIESEQPIVLRSPNSTRPWQHVLEPLSGYMLLGQKLREEPLKWRGSWNFGPDSSDVVTVGEVAATMISEFGKGSLTVEEVASEEHEAGLLKLNCDKARHLLHWSPTWNSTKTLQETANWYKRVLAGESISLVTKEQTYEFLGEKSD